jgi:nitrous oxide reductase
MIRDLRDSKTNRRKFLRDLATAGGLAAVAGSAGAVAAGPATTPEPPAKPSTGYRVTPHISKYYDKARF